MASNPALIRQQLNLKNLRRHDSSIEEIVASTSYTTVYYNTGKDWVKTNIEGPMFLFRRAVEPTHGFFILNRNGLEYVHELLTPDSEVRMEGEFILYEPHAEADRATGIWVWEEKERVALCARMEELRLLSCPPPAAPAPTTAPQSTPLDFLFASSLASPPAPAPAVVPAAKPQGKPSGMQLLDSIFKSANPPPPPPVKPEPPRDARDLLALIGHPTMLLPPPQPVAKPNPLLALLPQLPQQQQRPPIPQQQAANPQQQQLRSLPQQQQQQQPSPRQQPIPQQQQPSPQQHRSTLPQASLQQQRLLPIPTSQQPVSRPHPTQAVARPPPTQPVSRPAPTQPVPPPTAPRLPPTAPTTKPPVFAPPLLSHDVFALPLPKKVVAPVAVLAKAVPVSGSAAVVPVASLAKAAPARAETAIAPVKEKEALVAPSKAEPVKKVFVKAVPKDLALDLLDATASQARLGMNGKSHDGETEPLDKNEFVRELMALLQKSAVTTALYSGYLRRFSEEEEGR